MLAAAAFAIVAVLWLLAAVLEREKVRQALHRRTLRAVSVRWHPFGPGWVSRLPLNTFGSSFVVRYLDPLDRLHEACCVVRMWNEVVWLDDRILGAAPPKD